MMQIWKKTKKKVIRDNMCETEEEQISKLWGKFQDSLHSQEQPFSK